MTDELTITLPMHIERNGKRNELRAGEVPKPPTPGRVPRITKLMAIAIRLEQLVRDGVVRNYAEVARLGHVTRARATQILNLSCLAPDLQEALLFLPRTTSGRDPVRERMIRPIAAEPDWSKQRRMWREATDNGNTGERNS